ncbi:MAG: tRNA (N6-isopentenyl adenosine(37)-C2)-methylthiotransferase MiaB [Sphingomonadales bacterium]
MAKKVYIKSYGCQMNVYDSERMGDILEEEGFEPTPVPDQADLVILNTCHIREKAAEKVYSDIGRLRGIKEKKAERGKDMVIAVAGCVGQAEGAEIMRRAPSVELVFGPQTYHRLPGLLKKVGEDKKTAGNARVLDTDLPVNEKFEFLAKGPQKSGPSAFLTIQEGCDKFCTFCVVPYTRGGEFSRPASDIYKEAKALVARGAVDITLLGQNVNAYHGGDNGLAGLIRGLATIPGLHRIRYTTSHPRDMEDDLVNVHAEVPQCMPYMHLPVQSGSDKILKSMNRRHTVSEYMVWIEKIRKVRPDIALSSDFIVGFPGETDADFSATLELVKEVEYAQAYSFKYSPRPGTPAATSEDQVPEPVKAHRLQELQELLNTHQRAFNNKTVGRGVDVLFERAGKFPGQIVGRSPYMQAVHVSLGDSHEGAYDKAREDISALNTKNYMGRLVKVEITKAGPNSLEGKLVVPSKTRTAA